MNIRKTLLTTLCTTLAAVAFGERAEGVWDVFGSFGRAEGDVRVANGARVFETPAYRVETRAETDPATGVTLSKTTFTNLSKGELTVNCLLDRVAMDGGEYEVYTQANSWEYESRGAWQPLNTTIAARGACVAGSHGAVPMMAIWNAQTERGRVYHLLSDGAWQISATRRARLGGGTPNEVVLEMGVDSRHLNYALKPGESVALPEVLSYAFTNRRDLDCHKLHAYWNAKFPARRPPVTLYNSWLCRFDKLDYAFVLKQIEKAKALGADYFVLDAGWFGPKKDWWSVRGDWAERPDGWLGGRMADVSKAVRAAGLKFGFWVEAESAVTSSKIFKQHPEYFTFFNGMPFLDFTRKDAFDYLVNTVTALLEKYNADFLKFDFNQAADYDPTGRAFIAYNASYRAFIREIRRRRPGVYIEGCASGGLMMNLGWARDFDSFWLSDNQSPYHGQRIVKETMLRLPPRLIERWIVARTVENIQPDYNGRDSRIVATDNGTWTQLRQVSPAYLDAFLAGGVAGFSCDLTAFSDADLGHFARTLADRRRDAAFWNAAVGRILCDSPTCLALQYDDGRLDDIRLVVVSENALQASITLAPVFSPDADYLVDGKRRTAADLAANGVVAPVRIHDATIIRLQVVK